MALSGRPCEPCPNGCIGCRHGWSWLRRLATTLWWFED